MPTLRSLLPWRATRALIVALGWTVLAAAADSSRALRPNAFFAFDNGVGRGAQWTPEQQAELLATLGYQGIGYTGSADLAARQQAFRARGLRIFNLYVACYVDRFDPYDSGLLAALPALAGTDTELWLTVQGKTMDEQRAVAIVRDLADAASRHGVKLALYPHKGFYVATAEEALRLVGRVDRPNVGVTFNLCHELAAGHAARLPEIIRAAAPKLHFVSINGANPQGGWDELIRPLDEGSVNVESLLQELDRAGYRGPVGLQCYNVKGDIGTNLRRSLVAWRKFQPLAPSSSTP
jgi:sugar phosphate isomerase/epimerase